MIHTPYGCLTANELLRYVMYGRQSNPLELELAQRLQLAIDMIEELIQDADDDDTGSPRQAAH